MFIANIHLLRGLAVLMIVLFHVDSLFVWSNKEYLDVLKIFLRDSTAIFLFIAGYLFQFLSGQYNTKDYYLKKLKYVGLPYLIVSIPALVLFTFLQTKEGLPEAYAMYGPVEKIFMFLITGKHIEAFWFIPVMMFFYLLGPLLYRLDKDKKIYWLLPVFIVISILVPRNDNSLIEMFFHFFSLYLLGMFMSRYRKTFDVKLQQNSVLILLTILLIVISYFQQVFYGDISITVLQKMVFSVTVFALFYKLKETSYLYKVLNAFATTSFGIFFLHSYIIVGLKMTFNKVFGALPEGNVLLVVLTAAFVATSSMVLVFFIKKIFGKNSRLIIGS